MAGIGATSPSTHAPAIGWSLPPNASFETTPLNRRVEWFPAVLDLRARRSLFHSADRCAELSQRGSHSAGVLDAVR
jgi:hypothetical protein